MTDKITNNSPGIQKIIVYIVFAVVIFAVYWQVHTFDFINFDDVSYVIENPHIRSGITLKGFLWSFGTKYNDLWNPLIWLSFMADCQLYGLNAGGYHVTNLILHVLSTLLLFWLFHRMTGTIWRSAFVAAVFALHPLHVESVAWVSERKDTLSAFFWMLTLCLYVYYTEKPVIRRYLPVLFSFACALMSKPMVVTLPVVMLLLDYWPLDRLQSRKIEPKLESVPAANHKDKKKNKSKKGALAEKVSPPPTVQKLSEPKIGGILPLWQLKEKTPFFILSAILVIISLYNPNVSTGKLIPVSDRIANALVTFVVYLGKTFYPHNMAVYYPFPSHIPIWQVIGATLLIILITVSVIVMAKRLPYLFVGWFWYAVTIAPVIGIIQVSFSAPYEMADRYHYLPSIGLAVILAWGIPSLIKREDIQKKILLPAGIIVIAVLTVLTWIQCQYWKNSIELWNHALKVTKNNYIAYNNRGTVYSSLGRYESAMNDYNQAIRQNPGYADAYNNRGNIYKKLGQYQLAIEDNSKAIQLNPYSDKYYNNRGNTYVFLGQHQLAIGDYNQAIRLNPYFAEPYSNRGNIYNNLGQNELAVGDYNQAIRLKPDYADAYNNRAFVYLKTGNTNAGCIDAQKACELGVCATLNFAKAKGLCH
jgi:tetratricopeptide (TPR) repeat protein